MKPLRWSRCLIAILTDINLPYRTGVAWLGTLCKVAASGTAEGETTSGTGVTAITDREWQVMAHEIGEGESTSVAHLNNAD